MKTRPARFALLPVAGLALAAIVSCSSPVGAATKPHPSAQGIAAKLAPLGCVASPATSSATIGIAPRVELNCTINGESVSINQYRNADQIKRNLTVAQSAFGCSILKSFGLGSESYVQSGTTLTTAQTRSTARQIKNAIGRGAKLATIQCH
jgi:hypothetical protein